MAPERRNPLFICQEWEQKVGHSVGRDVPAFTGPPPRYTIDSGKEYPMSKYFMVEQMGTGVKRRVDDLAGCA
jgi:hypothetical protein